MGARNLQERAEKIAPSVTFSFDLTRNVRSVAASAVGTMLIVATKKGALSCSLLRCATVRGVSAADETRFKTATAGLNTGSAIDYRTESLC